MESNNVLENQWGKRQSLAVLDIVKYIILIDLFFVYLSACHSYTMTKQFVVLSDPEAILKSSLSSQTNQTKTHQ